MKALIVAIFFCAATAALVIWAMPPKMAAKPVYMTPTKLVH